jgi:hypothetical protein
MHNLDRIALLEACRIVAKSTLWQAPNPQDITDIIDVDQIERTVQAYYKEAEWQAEELSASDHDPNFVTRAVLYLAQEHAIPPMKDDLGWFREALAVLVRLISPLSVPDRNMTAFMQDLENAVRRYLEDCTSVE